jgi:amidophosphoribosyltransferase
MGLVPQVFNENILQGLKGNVAIGHVRYSTTGSSNLHNAQPIIVDLGKHGSAMLAHNGNLVNLMQLRDELAADGYQFEMSSDSELIAGMISKYFDGDLVSTMAKISTRIKGAFSFVILSQDKIIGVRDPNGIRPLCIGNLSNNKGFVIASESCALDIVGAEFIRDVQKGEIVSIDIHGIKSRMYDVVSRNAMCVFEFIYLARPDSVIHNRNVYKVRENMGMQLYKEHPVKADIVIAVPDSGVPAAIGYAKASGIPYEEGLIKNRYVGRTFINPSQLMREVGVRLKLNPLKDVLAGKRIVVIDDSIVRGTTSAKIVKVLRDAGAKEVHFRVSSPPIINPCFYGIDTASKDELIAANYSVKEIQEKLNVDSLGYLSIRGMIDAVNAPNKEFCLGCFNGDYPAEVPEQMSRLKLVFGEQAQ